MKYGFTLTYIEDILGIEKGENEVYGWTVLKTEYEDKKLLKSLQRGGSKKYEKLGGVNLKVGLSFETGVLNSNLIDILNSGGSTIMNVPVVKLVVDEEASELGGVSYEEGQDEEARELEVMDLIIEREGGEDATGVILEKYSGGRRGIVFYIEIDDLETTDIFFEYGKVVYLEDGTAEHESLLGFKLYKRYEEEGGEYELKEVGYMDYLTNEEVSEEDKAELMGLYDQVLGSDENYQRVFDDISLQNIVKGLISEGK